MTIEPCIKIFENDSYVPKTLNYIELLIISGVKLIIELLQVEEFSKYIGDEPTGEKVVIDFVGIAQAEAMH